MTTWKIQWGTRKDCPILRYSEIVEREPFVMTEEFYESLFELVEWEDGGYEVLPLAVENDES